MVMMRAIPFSHQGSVYDGKMRSINMNQPLCFSAALGHLTLWGEWRAQ